MPYDRQGRLVDQDGNPITPTDPFGNQGGYVPSNAPLQPLLDPNSTDNAFDSYQEVHRFPGTAIVGPEAAPAGALDDILGHAKQNDADLRGIVDQWAGTALPTLDRAANTANAAEGQALGELNQAYDNAGEISYFDQLGNLTSEGAKAFADKSSRASQYSALERLQGWSNPEVTPVEKFLQLQARRTQERDEKANRDAALRSMAARGVRSGGAEMAALMGSQQMNSNNRLMSDLGTQAGAVQRSLAATRDAGTLASTISDQTFNERLSTGQETDKMSRFNREQERSYLEGRAQHQVSERDKTVGRAENKASANMKVADSKFGRAGQMFDAGKAVTGAKVDVAQTGDAGIERADLLKLGAEEAEKARKALETPKDDRNWLETTFDVLADPGGMTGFNTDDKSKIYNRYGTNYVT